MRHSFPYGAAGGEKALFFIAYARQASTFNAMLANSSAPALTASPID